MLIENSTGRRAAFSVDTYDYLGRREGTAGAPFRFSSPAAQANPSLRSGSGRTRRLGRFERLFFCAVM
jgi:hypothetical protein